MPYTQWIVNMVATTARRERERSSTRNVISDGEGEQSKKTRTVGCCGSRNQNKVGSPLSPLLPHFLLPLSFLYLPLRNLEVSNLQSQYQKLSRECCHNTQTVRNRLEGMEERANTDREQVHTYMYITCMIVY